MIEAGSGRVVSPGIPQRLWRHLRRWLGIVVGLLAHYRLAQGLT